MKRFLALSEFRLKNLTRPSVRVGVNSLGGGSDANDDFGGSKVDLPLAAPRLENLQGVRIALVCSRAHSAEDLTNSRYTDLRRSLLKVGADVRLCTSLSPSVEGGLNDFQYDLLVVVEGAARGVDPTGVLAVDFGKMPKASTFAKEILMKVNKRGGVEGVIERLRANVIEAVEVEK